MSTERVVDERRARILEFQDAGSGRHFLMNSERENAGSTEGDKENSNRDLNEIEREAFQKGFESGKTSGLQIFEKKLERALKRFEESLEELSYLRHKIIRQSEKELIALAIEIAKKLVHREVKMDEKIILALVRVAVDKLASRNRIVIVLSQQDYEIVNANLDSILPDHVEREIELKPSAELGRGDCLIESDSGSVDGRLVEQFKEIEAGLIEGF